MWAVRNVRPSFNGPLGVLGGVLYSGVDTLLRGRVPWTLRHHKKGEINTNEYMDFQSTPAPPPRPPPGYKEPSPEHTGRLQKKEFRFTRNSKDWLHYLRKKRLEWLEIGKRKACPR
ncbi:hypothetical protein C8J57DRAFT_1556855 [Mycena rebaudengoi]|nr:hypothetical protein C8J57DRAFT_1556855 [Mycena rebaudengoi]